MLGERERACEWIYVSVALNRKQSSRIYTFDRKFVVCMYACVYRDHWQHQQANGDFVDCILASLLIGSDIE